jgi:hypothetical protein
MRQITIEPVLEHLLENTTSQVVLCDTAGRAIGFFSPLRDRPAINELQLEPPLSIAETEELRQKHRTGKPLEDILGRLGF